MRFGAPAGSAVLAEDDEWVPYTPPPSVSVDQAWNVSQTQVKPQTSSSGFDWAGMTTGLVGGLLNVFGQRVGPTGQPLPPPAPPSTPIWVYLAIPVALLGVVALMRRRPSASVAGYRRRRRSSRRSKR